MELIVYLNEIDHDGYVWGDLFNPDDTLNTSNFRFLNVDDPSLWEELADAELNDKGLERIGEWQRTTYRGRTGTREYATAKVNHRNHSDIFVDAGDTMFSLVYRWGDNRVEVKLMREVYEDKPKIYTPVKTAEERRAHLTEFHVYAEDNPKPVYTNRVFEVAEAFAIGWLSSNDKIPHY